MSKKLTRRQIVQNAFAVVISMASCGSDGSASKHQLLRTEDYLTCYPVLATMSRTMMLERLQTTTAYGLSMTTHLAHLSALDNYLQRGVEATSRYDQFNPRTNQGCEGLMHEVVSNHAVCINNIQNHRLFFEGLRVGNAEPSESFSLLICSKFGNLSGLKESFQNAAKSSKGWAWLALNLETCALLVHSMDYDVSGPSWPLFPIVALDLYEHAYYEDFGADREKYVLSLMSCIDWSYASARFALGLRMAEMMGRFDGLKHYEVSA